MTGTVYVVGAGLSGLAAVTALAKRGQKVEIIEAAPFAGGRCRSYHDAALDQIIDNGNHLVLSGNRAIFDYVRTIGAEKNFTGPGKAQFAFADLKSGAQWTLDISPGKIPWWIFSGKSRVPGTKASDYLALAALTRRGKEQRLDRIYPCRGALWDKLLNPLLIAALNTEPETASTLLVAEIFRETLAKSGAACMPRIAYPTLAAAFVDPAIAYAQTHGARLTFGNRVQRLVFDRDRVIALETAQGTIRLSDHDRVVLAVPPPAAEMLLPGLTVPNEFRSIVSGHFRIAPPKGAPALIGLLSGTVEWIFLFPDRISVTVSNAGHIVERDREELAATFWRETAAILKLSDPLPPWQIVKEKRATIAATPEQNQRRPDARSAYANLFLAGDWTDTGLPCTLEGAVRSGYRAAELVLGAA